MKANKARLKSPKELLKIDFNKYQTLIANGVVFHPTKLVVEEMDFDNTIQITGYKNGEDIFFISYREDDLIRISIDEERNFISIRLY